MPNLELEFESKEDSLSVRRFAVHEAMSSLFSVSIWARSPQDDIDLETIVSKAATFRIVSGMAFAASNTRSFHGVCSHMELLKAEPTGLSTYYLRLVPRLWLLTQRRNNRIFQHLSVPEIVEKLLHEWQIRHAFRVHRPDYPKLELRVQYGESDFDFVNRLLEEAGIAYYFADDDKHGSELVLHDAPHTAEPREGGPIAHNDSPNQAAEREFISGIRLAQQVRPGKVTMRDHDFRRAPRFGLFGDKGAGHGVEDMLEQYVYAPGGFLMELPHDAVHALAAEAAKELGLAKEAAKVEAVAAKAQAFEAKAQAIVHTAQGAGGGVEKKIEHAVEKAVGKKVHDAVGDKVGHAVEKQAEKVMGHKASQLAGKAAGAAAGLAAGKLAGKVAGELAGKLSQKLGITHVLAGLVGDDKGMSRFSSKLGTDRAQKALESARASRRSVTFETNCIDLSPGKVFSMGGHTRGDLGESKKLLATEFSLEGAPGEEWSMSAAAHFAEHPYRPPLKTPKPTIQGLQSAVVVGPGGEEIYTDEHGRVKVQFHWDREGGHDEGSSCWMRVSQGWAGTGYGMIAIPRVGHEVLVAFLEGDPDHPVVVGRFYNGTAPVPYDLPEHKTRSGWRTDSSPGSGGFNELMFEDAKGRELVYAQAERDLETLVKHNEARSVGVDRRTQIGAVDESHVGVRHNVTMRHAGDGGATFFEMIDKKIVLSTGDASITLDGPNITMEAKGRIFVHSSDDDVEILGGPWVKINCGPVKEESDTVTMHHITGVLRDQDGKPLPSYTVVVKGSDGAVQQVLTDGGGKYFALVPPGQCEVTLPGGKRYGTRGVGLDGMNSSPEVLNDAGPVG